MPKDRVHFAAADEGSPSASGTKAREPGRACAVCGVKLSLYNPGPHCWNHTIGYPWRGPSAKPKFPQ